MNIKRNQEYYENLAAEDICDCGYCKNYVKEIKAAYPSLAEYLEGIGVDIEKPFETMPLEPDENNNLEYLAGQYVVFGNREEFKNTKVGEVQLSMAESHPDTEIEEEHFVLEILPIYLNWNNEIKESDELSWNE